MKIAKMSFLISVLLLTTVHRSRGQIHFKPLKQIMNKVNIGILDKIIRLAAILIRAASVPELLNKEGKNDA